MLCGHLLLVFFGGVASFLVSFLVYGLGLFFLYAPVLWFLFLSEVSVAVLQRYIFAILVAYRWGHNQQESGLCWASRWVLREWGPAGLFRLIYEGLITT